jgi:DNA-directed RNA polymerase subunit RPC12/RpoP
MQYAERSYRCHVCGWQGRQAAAEGYGAAPCPGCGTYLDPLPWVQTWGVAVLLIGGSLAAVWAAVVFWK